MDNLLTTQPPERSMMIVANGTELQTLIIIRIK